MFNYNQSPAVDLDNVNESMQDRYRNNQRNHKIQKSVAWKDQSDDEDNTQTAGI